MNNEHKNQRDTVLKVYYYKPCLVITVGLQEFFSLFIYMTFFPEHFGHITCLLYTSDAADE